MANQYVNKVIANGVTKLDLTGDTVQESDVRSGQTFHSRSGASSVGTAAMVYNSSTEELTLPSWVVTLTNG